jgi:nucleolar pre-ribosomal-associated protein 2
MGSLGEGVREALLPGLWAVIEAMEVYSQDAIKSLSAAVNNSERAVLRSVYEDWKRFGKWEGL